MYKEFKHSLNRSVHEVLILITFARKWLKPPLNAQTDIKPQHGISNNVVCGTSKASDQPAHMCSLIRAFASRLNIL